MFPKIIRKLLLNPCKKDGDCSFLYWWGLKYYSGGRSWKEFSCNIGIVQTISPASIQWNSGNPIKDFGKKSFVMTLGEQKL